MKSINVDLLFIHTEMVIRRSVKHLVFVLQVVTNIHRKRSLNVVLIINKLQFKFFLPFVPQKLQLNQSPNR